MKKLNLIKFRWFQVSTLKSLTSVAETLNKREYSENTGAGFDMTQVSRNSISGNYIEKRILVRKFQDPFGNELKEDVVRYERVHFSISHLQSKALLLRLENPPRNLGKYFVSLIDAFDNDFNYSPILPALMELYESIAADELLERFSVDRAVANSVKLTVNSIAKIELSSQSNAVAELMSKFKSQTINFDRIHITGRIKGENAACELRASGTLQSTENFLPLVERALISCAFNRYIA